MIEWTEEQRALRRAMTHWGKALSEDHIGWDQRSEFPWHKWQVIRQSGVLRLPFPCDHGGLDVDLCTTMYVLEELGYACEDGGLNLATATHMVSVGIPLLRFGTPEQKARLLPRVCEVKVFAPMPSRNRAAGRTLSACAPPPSYATVAMY